MRMSGKITTPIINRVLLFGDDFGLPQSIKAIPTELICGLVGAEVRPHQHTNLQRLADVHHLPLLIQPRVSSTAYEVFVKKISDLAPDLIIVNSYSMLIHPEVLALSSFGGVNIHGALLPQYRGCNPTQWSLLNNETETGVTMHYMTGKFDVGDIIAQCRVPIYFEDTWLDITTRMAVATEAMLADELPKILTQTNTRQKQDETKASYYNHRHPEDGLIDWQQSILYIYNLVRALVKPHPGAFYYSGTDKVVLDEYLSIPKITALKYDLTVGGQILKSANVTLTPLMLADVPVMCDWINDRNQVSFVVSYQPMSQGQQQLWFENIQKRNDVLIFSVRLMETNNLIGLCQMININCVHHSAELKILLDEVVERDCGCYKEVVHLLLNFAFKDLNLHRVCLHVFSINMEEISAYEEVGFVQEGVLRQAAHIDGKYIDIIVMSILRNEYVG